jgi:hypothetical protein
MNTNHRQPHRANYLPMSFGSSVGWFAGGALVTVWVGGIIVGIGAVGISTVVRAVGIGVGAGVGDSV